MLTGGDIAEQHTDYISQDRELLCWEFASGVLEQHYGSYYGLPVKQALLQGLKTLALSNNRRIRDSRFTIWLGDVGPYYCLGVPGRLPSRVAHMLERFFNAVVGYRTSELGQLSELPLQPAFRYEGGYIIEYSDESVVGTEKVDDDEWYGSGLTITHRIAKPAFGRKDTCRE